MEKEIWRDIEGYEGLYQVSNKSNIKALEKKVLGIKDSNRKLKERLKKKSISKIGYEIVLLHKDGKYKTFYVHRLVAKAFIPNPNNYSVINHLDGNKANNNLENLEWCSISRNVKHGYETGLNSKCRAVKCIELNKSFYGESEASRFLFGDNHAQSTIGAAARGEKKSAYGYHWKFC